MNLALFQQPSVHPVGSLSCGRLRLELVFAQRCDTFKKDRKADDGMLA